LRWREKVTRQQRRSFATQMPLNRTQSTNTVSHQFGGDLRLKAVEFVVDRFEGNTDFILINKKNTTP
jgi:hypothetical protein